MINLFKMIIFNFTTILIFVLVLIFLFNKLKKIQIILLILILFIFYSPLPNLLVYSVERLNISSNINNIKQDFDKIVILSGHEDIRKTKKFNHLYLGGTNNRIIEGVRVHIKKKKI